MENEPLLKISVVNVTSRKKASEIYRTIEHDLRFKACYQLDGSKVTAAAIDFVAVIATVGAFAEIASFLYQLWKDHKEECQLFVAINPDKNVQILISQDTTEKEIQEFQNKINIELNNNQLNSFDKELLFEIKEKKYWIKMK
jgi:hypothetical protein